MAEAQAIGISDPVISALVENFYTSIRDDKLLGPIFAAHVSDWPTHLARMKDFWASITLESGRYRGNPMAKHIAIGDLNAAHFERWLQLWEQTVTENIPQGEAAQSFRQAAARIADSLLTAIKLQRGGLKALSTQQPKEA